MTAISGPAVSASFAYDALGRRTAKTINGESSSFLYDGLDTVRESGPNEDAAYLRTLSIDEALIRTDGTGTLSYLSDALGSTLALADGTGNLVTSYTYAPFGDTAISGTPSPNPFQFTGRENDGTGLYYYRARHYDPARARFISEDPLGVGGDDISLYWYVGDSPATVIDPYGLRFFPTLGRFLSPGQRTVGPPARPIPRVTPEPEPLPRWTPAPNPFPEWWQLRMPKQPLLPDPAQPCLDTPCIGPMGPGLSVSPMQIINKPGSGQPIPGPREKPKSQPEP